MPRHITRMSLDVPECHTCDITPTIHKPMSSSNLDLELQSNVPRFRDLCDILRHFETCPSRNQKLETRE